MPKVFDPFAGGGAIPLEAARLGCRSFGNDINPVAHIIQKGSLEFPQKYGKPITYSKNEFLRIYGENEWNKQPQENKKVNFGEVVAVNIENRLAFDVEFYARKIIAAAEEEIGHLYPSDEKGNKPIAYYWTRVGTCSNPSCRAAVPLLKDFYLCNIAGRSIYLEPIITKSNVDFKISYGKHDKEGWVKSKKLICPCCGSITDTNELKRQSISNSRFGLSS
jgi:putative DNA methylase